MENSSHVKHRPEVLPLTRVKEETPEIKSYHVNSPEIASNSSPGKFLMLWVIGVDEIPMAVSAAREDGTLGMAVEKVGDATSKLHELREGDLVGVRGPYGKGFDLSGEDLLIVGGGCGMAPLAYAAEEAVHRGKKVTVVLTAEKAEKLLFQSRLEDLELDLIVGTEDGSAGISGLTTDVLEKVSLDWEFDSCLLCGPEKMMIATAEVIDGKGVPIQVSLNRFMKCGFGLCGLCSLDPSGLRVCQEGPVFRYKDIKDGEFGDYKRDSAGRKIEI